MCSSIAPNGQQGLTSGSTLDGEPGVTAALVVALRAAMETHELNLSRRLWQRGGPLKVGHAVHCCN